MRKNSECIVVMSMNHSAKIVNFMAPGSRVQVLGWGKYSHIVKIIHINIIPHHDGVLFSM